MNKLKEVRESKNMSQEALAYKAGVSRLTVVNIEAGKTSPTLETCWKLAGALHTSIGELFPSES